MNLIYGVHDNPKTFRELILFAVQMVLSVFVATVLIASICGVNVPAALVGAGLSTIIYLIATKFESPMFLSNSGAFVAPVLTALALAGYNGVLIGGITTCAVYGIFAWLFKKIGVSRVYAIFPKALIGAVTCVIGLNLMAFISTYVQVGGVESQWGVAVALITMFAVAVIGHYAKGIWQILPFLGGTLIGYAVSVVITLLGFAPLIDFTPFCTMTLFQLPTFAFNQLSTNPIPVSIIVSIVILYIAYTISAMMEALSDHAALSGVIGKDLYINPSLTNIFMGEGLANLVGSAVGGLGICSYGEGVGCVGFSKVASTRVTLTAAIILMALGFIAPVQVFINSIPSCVFGGCAIILYGFIASSGIKMLKEVNLNNQKNLIIVSSVLSIGVCGIAVGGSVVRFSATALALIIGVILNLILKEKK